VVAPCAPEGTFLPFIRCGLAGQPFEHPAEVCIVSAALAIKVLLSGNGLPSLLAIAQLPGFSHSQSLKSLTLEELRHFNAGSQ